MSSSTFIKGLYAIVDDSFNHPIELARQIISGGCRLLQLRSKKMSTAEFLSTASEIQKICEKAEAIFIVNDRIDIALAVGAGGVHLGQDDIPLKAARKIIGNKIIGVSTHNLAETQAAQNEGANYIGFGPIFSTSTKLDAHAVQGIDKLISMRKEISIPIVAIGGVKKENMEELYNAGADAAAIISSLAKADDACGTTSKLMAIKG